MGTVICVVLEIGKSTLFGRKRECFQDDQTLITLRVFIKEPIKLLLTTLDGMLLKLIAQLTEVNFYVSQKVNFSVRLLYFSFHQKGSQVLGRVMRQDNFPNSADFVVS